MLNTRYIPENSQPITRLDLPAVVYAYNNKSTGQPAAIAYAGKSNKPTWHYRFGCDADRQARIEKFFEAIAYNEDQKIARKSERLSFKHGYKDGDILYSSWGYDQTNIEFYQVVAHTAKKITFREVCQTRKADGFMCGTCSPIPNEFKKDSKEYTRNVVPSSIHPETKGNVHFAEYDGGMMRYLWEWDGNPKGYSEYA